MNTKTENERKNMSKPTIPFNTVFFSMNGHSGYRPSFKLGDPVLDIDFAEEVVKEKRLSASPYEALHIVQAFVEIGPVMTAKDGRPRGITKLIKWTPRAGGSLPSPDSAWDDNTCIARIAPVLMADAPKKLDAIFRNVNDGIGVNLDNVTYLGATGVQNIIKPMVNFAAYGDHMEIIEGDTATITYGETVYPLTCVSSDVSKAEFEFPRALAAIPQGAQLQFEMRSRGGVAEGQVYTSRKTIVMGAYTEDVPLITSFKQGDLEEGTFRCSADDVVTVKGAGFRSLGVQTIKVGHRSGNTYDKQVNATDVLIVDDNTMRFKLPVNTSTMTDEELREATLSATLYTLTTLSAAYSLTYVG